MISLFLSFSSLLESLSFLNEKSFSYEIFRKFLACSCAENSQLFLSTPNK